jgi:hypothetical protein
MSPAIEINREPFPPFFKPVEHKKGKVVEILTPFVRPKSEKITSFVIGNIGFDGTIETLGLSETMFSRLCARLTNDTDSWVGVKLRLLGKMPQGRGMGWTWEIVEDVTA